jgi:hypothetical protein
MNSPLPTESGKDDAVARAAALVEHENAETRAAISRPVRARRGREIALVVLIAANLLGWVVFPPSGPDATDPRTPEAVERDLRLTVGGVAEDIEAWRAANAGRLPASLAALAHVDSAVAYSITDSATFELRSTDAGVTVSYHSRTSVADFIMGTRERKP